MLEKIIFIGGIASCIILFVYLLTKFYKTAENKISTRQIAGMGIISALTFVLGFVSNYVSFGPVNINLALVPIVVGACIYGPWWGFFLGTLDGLIILFAPSTLTYFMPANAVATVIICIFKTGLGGLIAGYLYKLIYKKQDLVASIVASLVVPLVNTGLFILGAYLFFLSIYGDILTLFTAVITVNFGIEFAVAIVLSPVVYKILKIATKGKDIGSVYGK